VQDTDPALLEKIIPKVNSEMNKKILAPFSVEDVRKAV
jgi:hypothetical protein